MFLRFKPGVTIDRGTFGKVTVVRVVSGGLEPVFEFNLHKVEPINSFIDSLLNIILISYSLELKAKHRCLILVTGGLSLL